MLIVIGSACLTSFDQQLGDRVLACAVIRVIARMLLPSQSRWRMWARSSAGSFLMPLYMTLMLERQAFSVIFGTPFSAIRRKAPFSPKGGVRYSPDRRRCPLAETTDFLQRLAKYLSVPDEPMNTFRAAFILFRSMAFLP